ncbi:MAG: ATP-binding protein [Bacteroidota bacterium]
MLSTGELDRLAALEAYRILDTEPEQLFDDITLLASRICKTPISLITLVDRDRQWFKSRVGFGLPETDRAHSVCSHAIETPDHTFVVEDLSADARFTTNPFVAPADGIRFYAGAPLVDSAGFALGTLCVIDDHPRELSEEEDFALKTLAKSVVTILEDRKRSRLFNFFYDQLHVIVNFGCPYFLFIDKKGVIRRYGSNFKYCVLGLSEGTPFDDLFEWEGVLNTEKIFSNTDGKASNLLFFRNKGGVLRFRGGYHAFEDFILVLSAPVINSQSGISDYGITLKDIPRHDYLSEYLFLQQTTSRSLRDAQALMEKIKQRSRDLEAAQKEIYSISLFPSENPSAILRFNEALELLYKNPSSLGFMKDFSIDADGVHDTELLQAMKEVIAQNQDYRNSYFQRGENFYSVWFRYVVERKYLNIYSTDITYYVRELNRKENELQVKNVELEKIREDLEVALKKETEINSIKSRFISMTSHEFRTPLTTIQSNAELLSIFLGGLKLSDGRAPSKYIGRITSEVSRLTSLMNDILLMGRIEAGRVPFNPVQTNLEEFFDELLETHPFDPLEQRKIEFRISGTPRPVSVDPFLFNHILVNLISNAIKYSPGKPAPEVLVIFGERATAVQVVDHGIGIPQSDLESIFDSFYRASNVENIQGTGMGLAIVKQFVDMHNGTVRIESTQGAGSTVTVTLPS